MAHTNFSINALENLESTHRVWLPLDSSKFKSYIHLSSGVNKQGRNIASSKFKNLLIDSFMVAPNYHIQYRKHKRNKKKRWKETNWFCFAFSLNLTVFPFPNQTAKISTMMTPEERALIERKDGDSEKKAPRCPTDSHSSYSGDSWENSKYGELLSQRYTHTHAFFFFFINMECLLSKVIIWIAEACFHFLRNMPKLLPA